MISLTYMSTATNPFTTDELDQLLEVSRTNNHARGLTGMLLYIDGHFIQTLEGEAEQVDAAFDRITKDLRHRDVLVALREELDAPRFPDWSMGYKRLNAEQGREVPGLNSYLTTGTVYPDEARDLGSAGIFHRIFRDGAR